MRNVFGQVRDARLRRCPRLRTTPYPYPPEHLSMVRIIGVKIDLDED